MASILDIIDNPDEGFDAWWAGFEEDEEDERQPAPVEPPERGVVSDVAVATGRGLAGIPELLLGAGAGAFELARETDPAKRARPADPALAEKVKPLDQEYDVPEILRGAGEEVGQWRDTAMPLSRQTLESDPEGFFTRRSLTQGVESGVTSLGTKLPAAFVGFVLGGPPGAVAGYLSGAPAFAAAQYDEARQAYLKKGLPEKEAHFAAVLEGASEWGFEEITDILQLLTLGAATPLSFTAKQALKQSAVKILQRPLATAAKKGATIAGTETIGELLNAGVQNEVQRVHGLHDKAFWTALRENLGPVAVSSMIFGTMGAGANLGQQYQIKRLLTTAEPEGLAPEAAAQHRARREEAAKQVADALAKVAPAAAIEFRRGAQVAIDTGAALPGEIDLEGPRRREAAAEAPPADAGTAHKIVGDQPDDEDGPGGGLPGGFRVAPTRTTAPAAPAAAPDLSTPEGRQAAIEAMLPDEAEAPAAEPDLRQILLGRPTGGQIGPQPDPIRQTREQMRGQLRQTPWERAQETRASQQAREAELEARLPELAVEAQRQLAEAARWSIELPENEKKRLQTIVARAADLEKRRAAEAAARAPRPVEPLQPADLAGIIGRPWPMTAGTLGPAGPTPVNWAQTAQQAGVAEPAPPAPQAAAPPATPVDWGAVARQAGIAEAPAAPAPMDVDPIFVELAQRAGLTVEDLFPAGTRLNIVPGAQGVPAPQPAPTPPAVSTPAAAAPAPTAAPPAAPPAPAPAPSGRQAPVRTVASGKAGPAEETKRDLSRIAESALIAFPDMMEAEGGLLPLSRFTPEEAASLRAAGVVEKATTSKGNEYEGVNAEYLWQRRKEIQAERSKKKTKTEAQPAEKEPWQMTKEEFLGGKTGTDEVAVSLAAHAKHVKQAVKDGQPVPAEVLQPYLHNHWAQQALKAQGKSAPAAPTPQAPAQPAATAPGVIGKNAEGVEIHADENGARYYVDGRVRITQSVPIVPGRKVGIPGPRELFERGSTEFLTAEELAAFQAEKEGAKAPQPAGPAATATKEAPAGPTVRVTRIEADGRKVQVAVSMAEARQELQENRTMLKRLKAVLECL